ncbi:MAG: DUF2935 domain-containing protein [Firmicutes bacterium]|nr:DUF2935 domain-containing protein [Bacillota bacterium]
MRPIRTDFITESLRQNRFWTQIMSEHALFIREGLPCGETALINEAIELQRLFAQLKARADQTPRDQAAVCALNRDVIQALDRIIAFKSVVLKRMITCQMGGFNYPLLIDHIRREAIRFRTNLEKLNNNIQTPIAELALEEEIFWLRIMGDHARFIAHLLDPSERPLVKRATQFGKDFETLRLQGLDLQSMLVPRDFENHLLPADLMGGPLPPGFDNLPEPFVIPRLRRFNEEVIEATMGIRDFKAAALELIEACKVLSLISPLLASHVLREAEMALGDLEMVNRELNKMKVE